MSRTTILSTLAAVALSAAIAAPALAAAPTYSGTLTCIHSGESVDLWPLDHATKKEIAEAKRFWSSNGYCEKGSVDDSELVKDA